MKKEFISPEMLRDSALKLVHRMHKADGFVPDIIYVSLRGGAYMGNVFSEYYKLIRKQAGERPVFYAAVVARSYENMKLESEVRIDGWTYSPEHLRTGDKILIVDDIFDTGKTVNALVGVILAKGIPRSDIKIAVFDYKIPNYKDIPRLPIQPDYYCRKHVLNSPQDETWIHYMNHEFIGLTSDEIDHEYTDTEVRDILHEVRCD
ncbi:MAG: phosphoribosyltransferase family protein [Sphaerochaetaceae bacterium]|jgi:hypoxanthine phosphoribosyltransferase|nr:phosphoribosyltransferase family protein [Sphaerochaetaceae bacterium]MDD3942241.1 phosphoribosyltransferase family protein [Sphaerochaetaceae bacterium]MDX9938892.1 phosphoribosyltransferase family protein [Sphaerochaetaceae bacterium]